jgi:hypothetical protein
MARVGRFCGAVLSESNGDFYIVGDLKTPSDYWEIVQDQVLRCS